MLFSIFYTIVLLDVFFVLPHPFVLILGLFFRFSSLLREWEEPQFIWLPARWTVGGRLYILVYECNFHLYLICFAILLPPVEHFVNGDYGLWAVLFVHVKRMDGLILGMKCSKSFRTFGLKDTLLQWQISWDRQPCIVIHETTKVNWETREELWFPFDAIRVSWVWPQNGYSSSVQPIWSIRLWRQSPNEVSKSPMSWFLRMKL